MPKAKLQDLIGKTMASVVVKKHDFDGAPDNEIVFTTTEGKRYHLYHDQECCEQVYIESIIGDVNDLIGHPFLMAEEVSRRGEPNYEDESCTWTFYKFATIKGYVDIRWSGESNGYYSENVDFEELANNPTGV